MTGKELIRIIQEKKLEEHDFCVVDRQDGTIKRPARNLIIWDNAKKIFSYNIEDSETGKVVILSD